MIISKINDIHFEWESIIWLDFLGDFEHSDAFAKATAPNKRRFAADKQTFDAVAALHILKLARRTKYLLTLARAAPVIPILVVCTFINVGACASANGVWLPSKFCANRTAFASIYALATAGISVVVRKRTLALVASVLVLSNCKDDASWAIYI